MRLTVMSLGILGALMVSGCASYENLHTDDADLARRILAQHCVVGQVTQGWTSKKIPAREGVVSKRNDGIFVYFKHKIQADRVVVYSIKDLYDGWVAVDASTHRVRDNLYFNRKSGEFACTTSEWRHVGTDPMARIFETTPLITHGMGGAF